MRLHLPHGRLPRWLALLVMFVAFSTVHYVAIVATVISNCPVNWVGEDWVSDMDPTSRIYRFCEGDSLYSNDQHGWGVIVPPVIFLALGIGWAVRPNTWLLRWAWAISTTLALGFYAPYWFLPA